jgi:quinohemoprotein amine dehydrogenase beta subunit
MLLQIKSPARKAALAVLMASTLASPVLARDYILTGAHTGKIYLFDAATRKVAGEAQVTGGPIFSVLPSPDGHKAYALTDRVSGLHGVDLDTGKEFFSASLSSGEIIGKGLCALALSPDGKELYTVAFRSRIKGAEVEVLDPEVQVFDTAAGLNARPLRTFPVARQTIQLEFSPDGSKLYAIGATIATLDPQSGKVLATLPVQKLERPNLSPPDMLDFWSQYNRTNIFVSPVFSTRTDVPATDPDAAKTGMLRFDLVTGEMRIDEFENTTAVLFSAVVNPVNHDEIFSVYTQLSKIDIAGKKLVKRINLDHTYYAVNISSDGKEVYVGGAMGDIAIYDSASLTKIGGMPIPDGSDMSVSWMQVIQRD